VLPSTKIPIMRTAVIIARDRVISFFFSSRRRHTRSKRDWSSDVCSSDLIIPGPSLTKSPWPPASQVHLRLFRRQQLIDGPLRNRSEERRVGKECRSRRWRYH